MIKVLATTSWIFSRDNCHEGGQIGQITKCEYEGIIFYVRENINGIPSFNISSGERWGDKTGKQVRKERQSLEVCADVKHWPLISKIVKEADNLKRPVRLNIQFTKQWAESQFSNILYDNQTSKTE